MMALLLEYALEAYEDCSYGNVSEQFNPHFITAMTERYADDSSSAPWVQAPLIFAMHRDLLYDDFGGDKLKIAEYAAAKSIQISPAAGTPSDIQDFYTESIEALWDEYYSNDGIIGQLLSSVGEDEKKILLTQEYTDLPEVVVADSVDEFVGRFTYYKMNWTEEAEIYKSEEWIRAEFKEYIFGLWEELLANCVGCADAVSGNEYDSSADFGTTDDAANWWSVYALIQRLGEDKTWADYYNHAQDIRTDGPKGRDIMPTDLVQIWEKLGRWLWSTDVSRESMSLDTPREKGSGIDWKKEIRNRYGYTFENDDGDPERTTTGAF
tara:strand:+ start:21 stop:989 length:969 start_codon:yes stop_codon:yes gene_type:complete